MESYGREEIGVSMYELYNSEQRLLLEMLESFPENDGGTIMKRTYYCSCGTRLSSQGRCQGNKTCARCARLNREKRWSK